MNILVVFEFVCGNANEFWVPPRSGNAPRPGLGNAPRLGHSTNMGFLDVGSAFCSPCLFSKETHGKISAIHMDGAYFVHLVTSP